MQLNNSNTGKIAIIEQWDLSNCRVKVYENGLLASLDKPNDTLVFRYNLELESEIDETLQTVEEQIIALIFSKLLLTEELKDFEISEDKSNWIFPTRTFRVSIDRQLALEAIYENSVLGLLFDQMRANLKEFIISNKNTLTVYLEELYDEHKQILEKHPGQIFIEKYES